MLELHLPWLELATVTPLLVAAFMGRSRRLESVYRITLAVCVITFLFSLGEWLDFTSLHTFEAYDHWDFAHRLTGWDIFVVDELSAPLAPLTALVSLMIVLATLPTKARRFPFRGVLVSLGVWMGLLSCREPWAIVALLLVSSIPPYTNIRQRGGSARVFVVHMALMCFLLIVGQILVDLYPEESGFANAGSVLLALGCLLRCGLIPVHCWITDLFEKASFGVSLQYVVPIAGAYAAMRLVYPTAPEIVLRSIVALSLVTAIYAAGMALVQSEARRFFCYLFLSFSSLVLVGIELVAPIGLTGALCIWLSVGLSMTGFGLTLRSLEARTGRLSMRVFHGLYEHTPKLAALFLVTGLGAIGFPGTVGFIGTELLVEGAVSFYPLVGVIVVLTTAMNGIAILGGYFRLFTGAKHKATVCLRADIKERVAILVLTALIILGGLAPQLGVASRYHAAVTLLKLRGAEVLSHHVEPPSDTGDDSVRASD